MAFCSQFFRMLIAFVKLKSWKFIFMVLVLAAAVSNNFLFDPVDSWILRFGEQDLQIVGPKEYRENIALIGDVTKFSVQFSIMGSSVARMTQTTDFLDSNTEGCDEDSTCFDKYFQFLAGKRSGKLVHHIAFSGKRAKLKCQVTTGTELYCPFSAYLVGLAQMEEPDARYEYKEVNAFRLISTIKTFSTISGGNKTVCKTNLNYSVVFPKTIMAQMLIVIGALGFYLLISTVHTIFELKQNGFLQLMFRRQMSVFAYWMSVWFITLLELIIFAAVLTVSYSFQCSGFYPTSKLINVFVCALLQFCCFAACILMLTILTRSIAIASFLTCLLLIVTGAIIVADRMYLSASNSSIMIKFALLVVPFGHIAEQVYETLLKGQIPANLVISLVLPVSSGMFVVLLILTIYLDSVLTPGNGRKLPGCYLFRRLFWSLRVEDRITLEDLHQSAMIEDMSNNFLPTLHVSKLKKSFKPCFGTAAQVLNDITVKFYRDQISAIVGHNGSGKSILMQILSGERHATSGVATFNKLPITDPLCRYHVGSDIGYCPQTDALVDRMSVIDTLKLVAASAGLSWDDVNLDVKAILSTLLIEDKLTCSIGSLSSSDKRKVCVTMALIGKPKVILLDSPSTDMDFISKRRMWKLLHEYKRGRTIIFSTLFMDEADGMADRLTFLSGGRVICAGSSFFFKRAFDCKYIIQIASRTEFHVAFIIRTIITKYETIRVRSISNSDVELEVSIAEDDILPGVALQVEEMSELIDEFGIAHYSLDDVFSKLKGLTAAQVQQHFQSSTIGYVADDVDRIKEINSRSKFALSEGPAVVEVQSSKLRTVAALTIAHFLLIKRSIVRLIIRVVIPAVLLIFLIIGSILEKGAKNDQMIIKFDLSASETMEREHGACFAYASADQTKLHTDRIPDDECAKALIGSNNSLLDIKTVELDTDIFKVGEFERALLDKSTLSTLTKLCKGVKGPCPVVYSSDWCPDKGGPVNNHIVYVGSYISRENYAPMNVAISTIEVYKNTFSYTTNKYAGAAGAIVKSTKPRTPAIDTEGIQDVRGIFFPFYGMFVQIAILALVPAICLNDVIQDKISGVRGQLLTMSMSRFHYWFCTFVTHWIQLAVIYLLSVVILIAVASPAYQNSFYLAAVFPLTLFLGLINSLLCVYAVSSLVSNVSYLVIAIYSCFSFLLSMSVLVVQSSDLLTQVLTFVVPHFAIIAPTFFGTRFIHYALSFYKSGNTGASNPNLLSYFFVMTQTRDALIAMIIHFVLLLLLIIALENRHRICGCCCKRKATDAIEKNLYADCRETTIKKEVNKVEQNPKNEEHLMEISQLQVQNSAGDLVVNNLTFGLKFGEIFGLLGPNGSGKGAAVRAVVGDQRPSAGRVDFHVIDRWLSNESALMQGFVGYCPKYNPLVERLTVRENLQFYAQAVGVPLERVQQIVRNFQLESEVNTIIMHATEAVKRRLSLAIAVLASPRMLVIDQATAGVDPEGRRIIWQTIKSLACRQRGMLIATQHMEEAETLCSRICILNAGMMAALNTIDELILRYKRMYFIEIQLGHLSNESEAATQRRKEDLVRAVLEKFYGSIVIEQLTFRIQFGVPINSIGCLSSALTWIVSKKEEFQVLYFTVHYATIDQTMKCIVVHHETEMLCMQEEHELARVHV